MVLILEGIQGLFVVEQILIRCPFFQSKQTFLVAVEEVVVLLHHVRQGLDLLGDALEGLVAVHGRTLGGRRGGGWRGRRSGGHGHYHELRGRRRCDGAERYRGNAHRGRDGCGRRNTQGYRLDRQGGGGRGNRSERNRGGRGNRSVGNG